MTVWKLEYFSEYPAGGEGAAGVASLKPLHIAGEDQRQRKKISMQKGMDLSKGTIPDWEDIESWDATRRRTRTESLGGQTMAEQAPIRLNTAAEDEAEAQENADDEEDEARASRHTCVAVSRGHGTPCYGFWLGRWKGPAL